MAAITLAGEPTRSLILTPNRYTAHSVSEELSALSPSPAIFFAHDIENSMEPFLNEEHAALVLHNRYDGLDLPGDACHLEWIYGLPGATNAQGSLPVESTWNPLATSGPHQNKVDAGTRTVYS